MSSRNLVLRSLVAGVLLCGVPAVAFPQVTLADDEDEWEVVVDSVEEEVIEMDSVMPVHTIADAFRQMPDSLLPYLSRNNRLDFIDYMESKMKAEVTNKLGGISEMTALTDDSLSIRMSASLRVDALLLHLDEPVDDISQCIAFIETFLTDSLYGESVIRLYTVYWQPITRELPFNEAQRKRLERLNLQNILKWDENILNNS